MAYDSMCFGSESIKQAQLSTQSSSSFEDSRHLSVNMSRLTIETDDTFASLLELAANNDADGFKRSVERDPSCVDEAELWYGRQKGSKTMVNEERTPLMVAATYGSLDVIKVVLSSSDADVNRFCGQDQSTALHCAASGGAVNAVDVVKLLLAAGADPNLIDANGHRPVDVIVVPRMLPNVKLALEALLETESSVAASNSFSPPKENGSPMNFMSNDAPIAPASERKEYPIDPSLPDIKNSIYSTDEFRMYSFKVRPCSRAYSHDWTECPFVHPGENARRRDPRKYHYSCVPCPDFRKGACRRGDMCEYAHGVFECWLHPAQYRTRLCKDGTSCARRVCFFAHTAEELRPLYVSTGSAVPSPRSMDFAAAMSLLPGSPSAMSPSPFTPPMSPSANGWPQPNVPALHLPASNLQSSRLRSSFNARDIPAEDYNMLPDFDMQQPQLLNEFSNLTQPFLGSNSLSRSGRLQTLNPSNLDDLFSSESSSPRFSAAFNQIQQQQSILSPKNIDNPLFQVPSSGRMSPRNLEPISPMSSRVSLLAQREKFCSLSSRELGSGSNAFLVSPSSPWSKWGSSNGKPDWAVSVDDLDTLRRSSSSFDKGGEEPDLSWVQSLVKESPTDSKEGASAPGVGSAGESLNKNSQADTDSLDHAALGAWFEQNQRDQLVSQQ